VDRGTCRENQFHAALLPYCELNAIIVALSMLKKLIDFKNPPVVEVVVSAQFAPIPGITSAFAGIFWDRDLCTRDSEWLAAKFLEAPRIEDVFEERQSLFRPHVIQLDFPGMSGNRIQIVRTGDERMVQLQGTRFVYNWRKRSGEYPSFAELLPEFNSLYSLFCNRLRSSGHEPPSENQWELAYINHIPKGQLWGQVGDWPSIIKWLSQSEAESPADVTIETTASSWRFTLGQNAARLHVQLQHAKTQEKGEEVLAINITTRGKIDESHSLQSGLLLGHDSIVTTFSAMTTDLAQGYWGRQ